MNKMRIAALVAAIATLGIFVAGCTPSEETAPATTGTTTGAPATGEKMNAPAGDKMAPTGDSKMSTPPGPAAGGK